MNQMDTDGNQAAGDGNVNILNPNEDGSGSPNIENSPVKNSDATETIKQEESATGEVSNKSPNSIPSISIVKGPPMHEIVGGSSVRRYLNEHLTQHLLDGLKEINKTKPSDPLRALGEFLIKRSEHEK